MIARRLARVFKERPEDVLEACQELDYSPQGCGVRGPGLVNLVGFVQSSESASLNGYGLVENRARNTSQVSD